MMSLKANFQNIKEIKIIKMKKDLKLQRIVMEVFGGCNYTCQMCPQSNPGRGKILLGKCL